MKSLRVILLLLAGTIPVFGQAMETSPLLRSYSGQFAVREIKHRAGYSISPRVMQVSIAGQTAFLLTTPLLSGEETNALQLSPETLVVSCERIKELFLRELGLHDDWRSRIDIVIDANLADEEAALTAFQDHGHCRYQLDLPKSIEPEKLVRSLVHAMLVETANRQSGQATQIPAWLTEGVAAHLQAYNLPTYIPRPNTQSAGFMNLRIEGMEAVRKGLRQHAPLTFQQLSWPEWSDIDGAGHPVYRSCAQLLYQNLLAMKGGQAHLREFLGELPQHLNWQTAFLDAFHKDFGTLLDVEKWWGLTCVAFSTANLDKENIEQDCFRKLQQALDVPVEIHLTKLGIPAPARLTLQEVIAQWDNERLLPALHRVVNDLRSLQMFNYQRDLNLDSSAAASKNAKEANAILGLQVRLNRELTPLVTQYMAVLMEYIKRAEHGMSALRNVEFRVAHLKSFRSETINELNDLDQRRDALRERISPIVKNQPMDSAKTREAKTTPAWPPAIR